MEIQAEAIETQFAAIERIYRWEIIEFAKMFTDDPDLILFDTEQEARDYCTTTNSNKDIEVKIFRNEGKVERVKTPTFLKKDETLYILPAFGLYSETTPLNEKNEPETDTVTSVRCHSVASNGYFNIDYQTEFGHNFTLNEEKGLQAPTSCEDVLNKGDGARIFFSIEALKAFSSEYSDTKIQDIVLFNDFKKAVDKLERQEAAQQYAMVAALE